MSRWQRDCRAPASVWTLWQALSHLPSRAMCPLTSSHCNATGGDGWPVRAARAVAAAWQSCAAHQRVDSDAMVCRCQQNPGCSTSLRAQLRKRAMSVMTTCVIHVPCRRVCCICLHISVVYVAPTTSSSSMGCRKATFIALAKWVRLVVRAGIVGAACGARRDRCPRHAEQSLKPTTVLQSWV